MAQQLGDPALHFYMTRGVAKALGVNIGDALRAGRLQPETYAKMVTKCRGCPLVTQCQTWLAGSHSCYDAPPPECKNTTEFQSLIAH